MSIVVRFFVKSVLEYNCPCTDDKKFEKSNLESRELIARV